jgi:hypothetical protein
LVGSPSNDPSGRKVNICTALRGLFY